MFSLRHGISGTVGVTHCPPPPLPPRGCNVASSLPRTVLFRQYDKDESGAIDDSEFRELAKAVSDACPMFPGSFGKAVREFDA